MIQLFQITQPPKMTQLVEMTNYLKWHSCLKLDQMTQPVQMMQLSQIAKPA